MRALAEYVIKGRTQASLVAVFATASYFFSWVAAAVIALVILRRGISEGNRVLVWALLPAFLLAGIGETGPVTTLVGAALAASVLRATVSWSYALLTTVAFGILTAVVLMTFGQAYIEQMLHLSDEFFQELQRQSKAQGKPEIEVVLPGAMQIAGALGFMKAVAIVLCLILARWWQASLYNPGGFQTEFHSLRLAPSVTVVLLASGLGLSLLGADYSYWALIFAVPMVFAGLGLVHGLCAQRQVNSNWLVFFYICWLFLDPLKAGLIVLAVVDSWMDFRGRLAKKGQ